MLKTAVAIRHIHCENLGYFEEVLVSVGYKVHYYDAGVDDLWTLDPVRTSLLVVLGGPMGVYEADRDPFLNEEMQLLRTRIAAGKPVMGICLGAQLIAHALGARVYPGSVKEIGPSPVALTEAGRASPLNGIRPDDPVLHWHGDTFDLPTGAVLMASTKAFPHQAFAVGRNILALQFHLEAGGNMDEWVVAHGDELQAEGIDPHDLQRRVEGHAPAMRRAATEVLSAWLARLSEGE